MNEQQLAPPSPSEIRTELEERVLGDLLGPAGGEDEEVAEFRVSERYILGMLAPRQTATSPEESDSLKVEGEPPTEEGEPEPDAPPNGTLLPSAYGMTFGVGEETTKLVVVASWGRYERRRSEIHEGGAQEPPMVWKRIAMGGTVEMMLTDGRLEPMAPDASESEVRIEGRARRVGSDWLVTLFLVNRQREPNQSKDTAWLFQAGFTVSAPDGTAIFRRRHLGAETPDDPEARALDMAYRDHVEFAVGHGVAVQVEPDDADPRRATGVSTAVVPSHEVWPTDATLSDVALLDEATLDMAALGEISSDRVRPALEPLAVAYESWIETQERRINDPSQRLEDHEATAREALVQCRRAADRIREGIHLVASDETAAEAFRFANRAMAKQRLHTMAAERRQRDPALSLEEVLAELDDPRNYSWRPFQLAFILLNLPSLTDVEHPERGGQGLIDLLWFPTGGGKTEAYLGLTAYTIGIRRLQGEVMRRDGTEGVAVIMRYTLRLLTIQQFQRATALLCACEAIRREAERDGDTRWGSTPFRVGLWVGMRATPNRTEDAARWLSQKRGSTGYVPGRQGSPEQLTVCPWCGSDIDPARDIECDEKGLWRTFLYCGDKYGRCLFSRKQSRNEGLPLLVVDEEIYRLLPDLLIGTVDKFAQLPWRGQVAALFGRVTGRCERHGYVTPDDEHPESHPKRGELPKAQTFPVGPLRPPDLIIQDELHLIAGPLGSMVGLYETAVDRLSTWQVGGRTVRPKVIASTATVRRAKYQGHALFWRNLEVFPPQGLDAEDSFFARQHAPGPESPGRRYLGLCAHGRRFKGVLIRVYVAQLAAAQALYEKYGAAVDPYMSIVGYFNSLRELGGMRRLVDDDVRSRLRRTEQRGLPRRTLGETQELTSRISSGDIPKVLERLGAGFDPSDEKRGPRPIDVCLATNMISVGVDVPRLGVMVVAGQPKATAEYIQATSRIGRANPGIVWTVYNWARPRDLSHYETFVHYHQTFYRQVEALSVTPFAPRALDRGLTALLVALARHEYLDWNPEAAAEDVDTHSEILDHVVDAVCERAVGVTAKADVKKNVRDALLHRRDAWEGQQAVEGRNLVYRKGSGTDVPLLKRPGIERWDEWTCLTSLRDVEPGVRLLLTESDLGAQRAPPYEPPPPPEDGGPEGADL